MTSEIQTVAINVGEMALSASPVVFSTTLGSCVSVFLYSVRHELGGLIHFALPNAPVGYQADDGLRYGHVAIQSLLHELTQRYGVNPEDLSAKIVGGATNHSVNGGNAEIGSMNIQIAKKILYEQNIPIVGESLGGSSGRKVLFHLPSGRVQVQLLSTTQAQLKESTPYPALQAVKRKIKVLIVDDSKTIRELLTRILSEDPDLEVLPPAASAKEASIAIKKIRPDVMTLDIHMPEMSGVQWLEKHLPDYPIPTVMISSLQFQEGNEVFRALELGAVDYIQKPSLSELPVMAPAIREKIHMAAKARVYARLETTIPLKRTGIDLDCKKIIAFGASTGGTEALKKIICSLPEKIPPILVVQHIPPQFSRAFANRLNDLCPFLVKEAEDMEEVQPGKVLIAPGGFQMKVQRLDSSRLCVRINDDAPVNRHKPSVDYLFDTVAKFVGSQAVGVILTGMGNDGAAGLLRMRNSGATTIGQDEHSSVVFGMPKVAFEMGAVQSVLNLDKIPEAILEAVRRKSLAS